MHMLWMEKIGAGMQVQDPLWELALSLSVLGVLVGCLAAAWFIIGRRAVRIYNWNGRKYCYLGRAALRASGGGYLVRIGERMADLSDTTLYQICPSKGFIRRNRYEELLLCAGKAQCTLPVEECMRQSIYYK